MVSLCAYKHYGWYFVLSKVSEQEAFVSCAIQGVLRFEHNHDTINLVQERIDSSPSVLCRAFFISRSNDSLVALETLVRKVSEGPALPLLNTHGWNCKQRLLLLSQSPVEDPS